MRHSASSARLKEEFDHIFSDQELEHLLSRVAAAESTQEDVLGEMLADGPLGLQFFPPTKAELPDFPALGTTLANGPAGHSQMSSFDDLPRSASAAAAVAAAQAQANLQALIGSSQHGGTHAIDALSSLATALPQPLAAGLAQSPYAPPPASTASTQRGHSSKGHDTKPQISHSTVEKQRRDRINSLIDELRDLVPPSKATMAAAAAANGGNMASARDAANTEARRPKHVVLADTIALLKQLAQRGPLTSLLAAPIMMPGAPGPSALAPPPPPLTNGVAKPKQEHHLSPSNSNSKGSVSSHEDCEMKDDGTAAPKLPAIPIQPTQLSGVVVERGPDCMYVQVKCRDRKGLLLDIIHAMKQLPLEVRTAAVTTQDGLVRDVFEVQVDDQALQPEDVQNMVHEALFQPWHAGDKRTRC